MDYWEVIGIILASQVANSPLYLAYLAGMIIALVKRKEHGRNSILFIIIIFSVWILDITSSSLSIYLPIYLSQSDYSAQQTGVLIGVMSISISIFMAVLWGLLIYLVLFRSQPKIEN